MSISNFQESLPSVKQKPVKLHTVIEVHKEPYFRKMKVESGWMYNFWDVEKERYRTEWIFVPSPQFY